MVKFVYDEENDLIKCFKVYEVEEPKLKKDNSRYFSIDPGLNNIVSIYNNIGIRPLLYNGRPIKSINQYYNKINAKLRSELPDNIKSSKRLKQLSFKRNNKIDYEMHKISTHIINEAVKVYGEVEKRLNKNENERETLRIIKDDLNKYLDKSYFDYNSKGFIINIKRDDKNLCQEIENHLNSKSKEVI